MKNKLIVWGLILATSVILLPGAMLASSVLPESFEKTAGVTSYEYSAADSPQRRGRGRGSRSRGRGRGSDDHLEGGHRSRHHARRSHHRTRTVRQVYYRNGRRYVRSVRVHN
jgi:hypothetical protein